MNAMNYDRITLKERARGSLQKAKTRPWKATLAFVLVATVIPGIITALLPDANRAAAQAMLYDLVVNPDYIMGMIQRWGYGGVKDHYLALCAPSVGVAMAVNVATLLINFFRMVMSFGYTHYALKLYRREETCVKDVFYGFSIAGQAIGTGIMTGLFLFLWTIPALVLMGCALMIFFAVMAAAALNAGAVTVLTAVFAGVLTVGLVIYMSFIGYRYSLAPYYILTDHMSIMDAIRASKEAMRGNLSRRFKLSLSFLGWELLVTLILLLVFAVGCFATYVVAVLYVDIVDVFYLNWDLYVIGVTVGVVISFLAGFVASLPLGLWLIAYRGSSYAGFFLVITGQEHKTPPVSSHFPPAPPRPAGGSIWDNVPTPPGFTTPPPVPPAPPAPPTPPQPPVSPEPPAWPGDAPGPNDPVPEESAAESVEAEPPEEENG